MLTPIKEDAMDLRPRMSGGKDSALIWAECEGKRYRLLASRELLEDEFPNFQLIDGDLLVGELVDKLLPIFERMYTASDMEEPPEARTSHKADIILTTANYAKYRT